MNKECKRAQQFVGVTIHADQGGTNDLYPGHPLLYVERDTIELLRSVGLEPFLIPIYKDGSLPPLDHIRALIITGGGYLSISEKNSSLSNLRSSGTERYQAEKRLIEYGLLNNLPMIGFCRGAQMINEVSGGTLISLPDDGFEHHQERHNIPSDETVHDIKIETKSKLFDMIKEKEVPVNSFHRQHIDRLGKNLKVSARSKPDQVIEAFESTAHDFVFGFQFHPEKLTEKHMYWRSFFEEFAREIDR
ncbi:gamma-glutamyl-gamma-aminobutyrate hydrolase family protein [Alkalihalophilus sp. As8PL]|uniref:Gamma-glutamyl-gamma-aminobutyrate hydrolase family protein n=1 Tax=Alkalihalophilus sp. As8PL TaxID=3237103 RepID=A0AB39BP52_9BACI